MTAYTNINFLQTRRKFYCWSVNFLFPIFIIKCASSTFYLSLIDHKTWTLFLSYHAAKWRDIAHSVALCWVKSENSSLTFVALIKKWWQHWWYVMVVIWFQGTRTERFLLFDIVHCYKSWYRTTQWTKQESDGTVNHKLLLHNLRFKWNEAIHTSQIRFNRQTALPGLITHFILSQLEIAAAHNVLFFQFHIGSMHRFVGVPKAVYAPPSLHLSMTAISELQWSRHTIVLCLWWKRATFQHCTQTQVPKNRRTWKKQYEIELLFWKGGSGVSLMDGCH